MGRSCAGSRGMHGLELFGCSAVEDDGGDGAVRHHGREYLMTSARSDRFTSPQPRCSRRMVVAAVGALIVVAVAVTLVVVTARSHQPTPIALPLRTTGELALPGNSSRFDYASLDTGRGLLFIAHLGASEIIEVDIHAHHVMRTILNLPQVHGVLVVPALHRVYATATGTNLMVSLDEDTGAVPTRTPSGEYPDGLAYDPRRAAIWTTNETSGSETVIDAVTGAVRGTVALGAEAGNVAYDPNSDQMLVAVQGHNQLAIIDPATLTVTARVPLPGCQHSTGWPWIRATGLRSSPATATPPCSPLT
jgi:hypothetical protein